MHWIDVHHPDISWPVVRRRAGIEMMEMLEMISLFMTRGGWGLLNRSCYPNQSAYLNAVSRLRRNGLIVMRREDGTTPHLVLSDKGRQVVPDYFRPEKHWDRKWNKIWYMLVYDVPEADRPYRNTLRGLLKRMRMGCLQQSVWVTPHDIRPEFEDLARAAGVGSFAYLFEAKTVLGLPSRQVAEDAWDFDRLRKLQAHYCTVMEENAARLENSRCSREELAAVVRKAVDAYHGVFIEDPLLPSALCPAGYRGMQVLKLHRRLLSCIDSKVRNLSSD
jgi:phenylacetic acid degradation operon negative regulatory protein